ncbi:LpqB family beta-propeller domain-containing protein [Brevibacterium sp.]|uniref:LpqB family beta-propeller domain-containing protein n=1 Tax=Brevibacterium sp. TaxID=1701 RepID=UPI00264A3692|nr:LpqB family beta-propeller domain-containing protein [Brevibacterium sp.]MDN5806034.1 LpqB family beta-propeller domain-containing protein [Brevibacterium sp.]MDN5832543.1 LpqB family beta-propeller domain-containing protein [Brevibacterium sp.]MDN6156880.1 LpqB family beta-propeller domain-containing protein [Brevibacterium sp.]MDN6602644.1 LpqB family beta-propeller domain-containing protein [Brevibacterium sp.]MDN6666817.1 LpqB family beta-propeller domain-containing protein [Brevibacter
MTTPRRKKGLHMLVLAAVASLALTACSSIPSNSPVGHIEAGSGAPGDSSARIPDGPEPGDSIGEIVRGFLSAGAGAGNNFSVAKSFLTEAEAQEWSPQESVSVLPNDTDLDKLNQNVTSDQKTLTMSVPVVGLVDSSGIYNSTKPGTQSNMEFSLRQENGEWRIASAPDGLLISQTEFQTIFLNYSLEFFTSDYSYLVPDSRWFLRSSSTPTALINELLSGPASYLSGAVVTAIPDGVKLSDTNVVTIENGVAHIALGNQGAAPTDREKGLIRQQIASTLKVIPSISSIELTIGGQVVSESLQPKTDSSVQVDGPPVVLTKDRLSRISGTTVAKVENSPDLSEAKASDPAVSFDDSLYVYLQNSGKQLMRLKADAVDATPILKGKKLVRPSIDRFNTVWTGERDNKGKLTAIGDDSQEYTVAADFLSGRDLIDLEVSRDGTRIAVLSRHKGEPSRIDVVGIPRDKAGNPASAVADAPIEVGSNFDEVKDFSWAGSTSLVALAAKEGEQVQPFRIGVTGPPAQLGEVPDGSRIASGEDGRSILVTSSSGEIYSYNSNAWQKLIDISAKDPSYPG